MPLALRRYLSLYLRIDVSIFLPNLPTFTSRLDGIEDKFAVSYLLTDQFAQDDACGLPPAKWSSVKHGFRCMVPECSGASLSLSRQDEECRERDTKQKRTKPRHDNRRMKDGSNVCGPGLVSAAPMNGPTALTPFMATPISPVALSI